MKHRPTILHIIDSLGIGGAEILYVDLLPELSKQFKIVLVTLSDINEFGDVDQYLAAKYILNYSNYFDIFPASKRLKAIIDKHSPVLVHSHLFWSTIISRLAITRGVPFYFSVHATINDDPIAFHKKLFLSLVEKATYHPSQRMIGVAQAVIDSFKKIHRKYGQTYLLHNFVRDEFFKVMYEQVYSKGKVLRLVSVSNLRLIKNIPYMIEALNSLKGQNIMLDIYGDGPLRNEVQKLITQYQLYNVQLKGKVTNIHSVIANYDVFLSSSKVEGFGIAVAEAMSVGLPVIISDIPVYKEVCKDHAIYIDPDDSESLRKVLEKIINGEIDLKVLSENNRNFSIEHYSKIEYLNKLNAIYNGYRIENSSQAF